jgi:hypothetical protein
MDLPGHALVPYIGLLVPYSSDVPSIVSAEVCILPRHFCLSYHINYLDACSQNIPLEGLDAWKSVGPCLHRW